MSTTSNDLKIQVEFGMVILPGSYRNCTPYVYNRCDMDRSVELAEITRVRFYRFQRVMLPAKKGPTRKPHSLNHRLKTSWTILRGTL